MPSIHKKIQKNRAIKKSIVFVLFYICANVLYLIFFIYVLSRVNNLFHKYIEFFTFSAIFLIFANSIILFYILFKTFVEKYRYVSLFNRTLEKIERLTQQIFILKKDKIRNFRPENDCKNKIIELAYFDTNTGLPNMLQLDIFLDKLFNNEIEKVNEVAFIYFDIKGIEHIQRLISCQIGKMLLKDIGFKIGNLLPQKSFLAKMDDFGYAIVLYNYGCNYTLFEYLKKIAQLIKGRWYILGQEFSLDIMGGIALFPADSKRKSDLLSKAKSALETAKNKFGSGFYFFNNRVNVLFKNNLDLVEKLKKAVSNDEFALVYHPIVDILENKVRGAEVLLRWSNQDKGLVPASDFIFSATIEGMLPRIERWVFKKVIEEIDFLKEICNDDFIITINSSFIDPTALESLFKEEMVNNLGQIKSNIGIELNQKDIDFNIFSALNVANEFKHHGIKLILDDYYSGCYSIDVLKYYPIDVIKIDKMCINELIYDNKQKMILKGLIDLAHSLKIKVVAERVETKHQYNLVKEIGCDWVQGYYITKPLIKNEFLKFLELYSNGLPKLSA